MQCPRPKAIQYLNLYTGSMHLAARSSYKGAKHIDLAISSSCDSSLQISAGSEIFIMSVAEVRVGITYL